MSKSADLIEVGRDVGRLEALVDEVLKETARQGASAAEAAISTSSGLSVAVRLGEVETIEHVRDKGLGVNAYFGHKKGSASTTDFAPAAVKETVRAACEIACYTAEDPCAGLADAELMAREVPDLDLFHPWELEPDAAIRLALESEDAARSVDPRITNSEGASVDRYRQSHVYGNTHGFIGGYSGTRHSISCSVIAQDEAGMQRDHWYTVGCSPDDLEAAAEVGRKAGERALRRLDARQVPTCSVPVLFSAEVASGLFAHFVAAVSGGNLYRNASFLVDHLGRQIFPQHLRIHEQPHLAKALGSAPFDNEGVATRARDIVSQGVLQGYVLSSYSARKLGTQTTGNAGGVHNLTVEPGSHGFDDLVRLMGEGLIVTDLMGMGINIVTGDYSRGASGYWVEGGEIRYPVQEITIAGNLRDMFLGIREVGNDVDRRGNVRTGSVLIERMTVAGQ
ncbi:MAG: metalloprotease PmbA [Gammaproteobacteria bacterium]|nr:metalloprotease PmbA [Gammaproteobacteria bacterium]NIR83664.1 metalloprotease PmbA [Gammaproteobacteria bacterium]NIR91639.1 metalloprotease PmbA [Gammaproteobacteria bacterium]NIU04826.1 metalloprotease PmbA [Gammaproteobacteria bacterium]NIV51812.1 metalloprotease PmbA [Gammaproteobacteria bacterium]